MSIDLDELERLARALGDGCDDWALERKPAITGRDEPDFCYWDVYPVHKDDPPRATVTVHGGERMAEYLGAVSPVRVLALAQEVRGLRVAVAKAAEVVKERDEARADHEKVLKELSETWIELGRVEIHHETATRKLGEALRERNEAEAERDAALARAQASDVAAQLLADEVERLEDDIDEHLPEYVLDDGTGEPANHRERIEYAGDELKRAQARVRELEARLSELERQAIPRPAREGDAVTWCPQCGYGVAVDEDGCCLGCGADAMGPGVDEALAVRGQARELEAQAAAVQPLIDAVRKDRDSALADDAVPCECERCQALGQYERAAAAYQAAGKERGR